MFQCENCWWYGKDIDCPADFNIDTYKCKNFRHKNNDFYSRKGVIMQYQLIVTHNPQDFFEDKEPDELVQAMIATDETIQSDIKTLIQGGYKVIVLEREDS